MGAIARAKLTSKGQLTMTRLVRQRTGIGPGDRTESPFQRYQEALAHLAGHDPDAPVAELRDAARRHRAPPSISIGGVS